MEPVLRVVFDRPASFWDPEREERVLTEPREIGALGLTTGHLAIHDPGYEFAPEALDRSVPPGMHAVDLAVRSWRADNGTISPAAMIAAVRVTVRPGEAQRFVPVRTSSGDRELTIGVDSGLVAIFDRALLSRLGSTAILDAIPGIVPQSAPGKPRGHIVSVPGGGGIFVGQAYMGDGSYRASWGLDADDEAVELIVDFGVLQFSLWRTFEFPSKAFLGSRAELRLALARTGLDLAPVPAASIGVPIGRSSPDDVVAIRRESTAARGVPGARRRRNDPWQPRARPVVPRSVVRPVRCRHA